MKNFFHIELLIIFYFLLYVNYSFSQTKIDSLKAALSNTKEACPEPCFGDTTKVNLLNILGWELHYQNPDTSILLGKQALEIAMKNGYQKGVANINSNLGIYYKNKGDYPLSLSHHFKALEIRKQHNNNKGIVISLGNIGIVYSEQGNYPKALKYYFEALVIAKELGNKNLMANNFGNIGIVYDEQADAARYRQDIAMSDSLYAKALKHYFSALEINKELGNKNVMAINLGNIGIVYKQQAGAAKCRQDIAMSDSLYAKALKHYFSALEINKELGIKNGIARNLGNIGNVHNEQASAAKSRQNFALSDSLNAKALKHYFEALVIDKELGDKNGTAIRLGNIGSLYTQTGRFKEAEMYLDSALAIDTVISFLDHTRNTYLQLSHLYDTTARYQLAYHHYKKYSTAKDSLFNEEKSKEVGRLEQNHVFEMEELKNERIKNEELMRKNEEIKRRNILQYSAIFLTLIFLFMGIFLLARRFRKIKDNVIASAAKQSPDKNNWRRLLQSFLLRNDVKVLEAALFVSFLIFFEFILVLLAPFLEKITGGEPAWKLLANAVLAGIIFPLHKILEAKLKARVMKKEDGSRMQEKNSGSKTLLLLVGFGLILLFNNSFSDKTDSLKTAIGNAKEDTTKVNLLSDLGWELQYQNLDTSILLGKQALEIAIKNNYQKGIANSYNDLGVYYKRKGDYLLSLSHHFKALEIRIQLDNKKSIAASLGNIGIVYWNQGNYPKALKHYFETLVIDKELGNKNGMASGLSNIGLVYNDQANAANSRQDIAMSDSLYTKALKHYFEALLINKELGNKKHMVANLGNIGIVYYEQANAAKSQKDITGSNLLYAKALKYCFEALEIAKELGDKNQMSANIGNIGNIYKAQADVAKFRQDIAMSDFLYSKALKHYFVSLEIAKEQGNKNGITIRLGNIGSLYTQIGRFKEAELYLDSALTLSESIGALLSQQDHHKMLSHLYDTTARYQLALNHYKKYSTAKDSLFNEEKSKDIGRLEQNHLFEMEELKNEIIKNEELRVKNEEIKRRNLLQYSSIFLALLFLFGLVFFLMKISLPEWMVELSTFVPFMILFEFILVLLDPYIENITGGEPLYTLLFNALCAAIIFPIHSFFEKKLKARIYDIKQKKEKQFEEEFRKEEERLKRLNG